MDWVVQRFNERNELSRRRERINQDFDRLAEELWKAIREVVAAYKATAGDDSLETGLDGHGYYVAIFELDRTEQRREKERATVALNRSEASIEAAIGRREPLRFHVALHKGSACLTLRGKEIMPQDAAREILDSFLFSDVVEAKKQNSPLRERLPSPLAVQIVTPAGQGR